LTLTFHLWVIKGKVENKDKNFIENLSIKKL